MRDRAVGSEPASTPGGGGGGGPVGGLLGMGAAIGLPQSTCHYTVFACKRAGYHAVNHEVDSISFNNHLPDIVIT